MTKSIAYTKGWHELVRDTYAYLQPSGQWGYSNAGLVVGAGARLLVDTLFSLSLTREMLDGIETLAPGDQRIDWLINTHANGDHCFGNQLVAGATIIASEPTTHDVAHDDPNLISATLEAAPRLGELGAYFTRCFGDFNFENIVMTPPNRTFSGDMTIDVGGRAVRLMELGPAHTSGDVVAFVPDAGVLYSGDLLFIGGTPIAWAGPLEHWIEACDTMSHLGAEFVVPGHGPVTNASGIADVRGYLEYVLRASTQRHAQGMDVWSATLDIDISRYAHWLDRERLAVNVATSYHGIDPVNFAPVTPIDAFSMMSRYEATFQ